MANLLMIDDNPQSQKYLERIIRLRTPHRLDFAGTAAEGIKKIIAHRPDVLFLDLYIPGMDGIDLFEKLRSHPTTQDLPVIFHSAVPLDPVAQMRLDKLHFEGFVEFPIEASALNHIIAIALRRGQTPARKWQPPPA
jgi:CheY-like chemotaxis protein